MLGVTRYNVLVGRKILSISRKKKWYSHHSHVNNVLINIMNLLCNSKLFMRALPYTWDAHIKKLLKNFLQPPQHLAHILNILFLLRIHSFLVPSELALLAMSAASK